MSLEISMGSPAAKNFVNSMWDGGKLWNDAGVMAQHVREWKFIPNFGTKMDGCGSMTFQDESALVIFLLRWS